MMNTSGDSVAGLHILLLIGFYAVVTKRNIIRSHRVSRSSRGHLFFALVASRATRCRRNHGT